MSLDTAAARSLAAAYTAAWNTRRPEAVAAFFDPEGVIMINGGDPWTGRAAVAAMAAGFFADVPDLTLVCNGVRVAGDHLLYLWSFTGHHAATQILLRVTGWEEWDLNASGLVRLSRGWFDAEDYAQQTAAKL